MKHHSQIDERSLAMHRLIAEKLRADRGVLEHARANIERWLQTCGSGVRPALCEWQRLLIGPLDELLALLHGTDERAVRLRQSSPFAGCLTTAERNAILTEFHRTGSGSCATSQNVFESDAERLSAEARLKRITEGVRK